MTENKICELNPSLSPSVPLACMSGVMSVHTGVCTVLANVWNSKHCAMPHYCRSMQILLNHFCFPPQHCCAFFNFKTFFFFFKLSTLTSIYIFCQIREYILQLVWVQNLMSRSPSSRDSNGGEEGIFFFFNKDSLERRIERKQQTKRTTLKLYGRTWTHFRGQRWRLMFIPACMHTCECMCWGFVAVSSVVC